MRCTSCNYALWNMADRTCPECGEIFQPSQFTFAPGRVRFSCPHCDEVYYGTSERGHLQPAEFECVGCGQRIAMDDMLLSPGDGVREQDTTPGSMPWLQRQHRGVLMALFQTIGMALVRPRRLMSGVPADASVGESLVFGVITTVAVYLVGGIVPLAMWIMGFMGPGGMGGWGMAVFFGYYILFGAVTTVSVLLIWPMVAHLALRITGGTEQGLDRTIQAIGYSAGANVISAVPCFGMYIGWLWWLVSATVMVQTAHRVSPGRAALSVLAAPLLAIVTVIVVINISVFAATTGGAFGGGWNPQQQNTMTLAGAIVNYGWQNAGNGPEHAVELTLSGNIGPWTFAGATPAPSPFLQPGTKTTESDLPVGTGSLADFVKMSRSARLGEIKTTLDAQPAGRVAHRFGDFVFTHHGVDLSTQDPSLWVVVMLPDPDVNGPPAAVDPVYIGYASYQVHEITYGAMAQELATQNQYRTGLGMPPLPDPVTVTHGTPAFAPATGSPSQ
ncbi:MAG: hypothetical protein GY715_22065 [Planctomycetes bacterium]|nr:hypothetical protein [Planctomycetota bacterium]